MGNLALCAPSTICSSSVGGVRVLSSDGRLMVYTEGTVRAAEIMLENPGQFLCESSNLRVGHRIPGVCAEEELEKGQNYFLLPMEMLYSVLTDEEMMSLTVIHKGKASRGIKQAAAAPSLDFSKIFPEFCLFPNASSSRAGNAVEDDSEAAVGGVTTTDSQQPGLGRYYSRQRSWQPALETILETPPPHI